MRESKRYIELTDKNIISKIRLNPYDDNNLTKIDKYLLDEVIEKYINVFGEFSDFVYGSLKSFCYNFEYDEEDKCFYGYSYPGGGMGLQYSTYLYDVEKNDDEIYLFDYYAELRSYNELDRSGNYIIGSNDSFHSLKDLGDKIPTQEELEKYTKEFKEPHKHTFKLNSSTGEYYWISSEPLE